MFQGSMNKSKGISLVEILMAVLIFGTTAFALFIPVSNSFHTTTDNKNINTANTLARSYLKDLQNEWKLQAAFDQGILITPGSTYTNNGEYSVQMASQDIEVDDEGVVLVRRVNIAYRDDDYNVLTDINYDYRRPGNI